MSLGFNGDSKIVEAQKGTFTRPKHFSVKESLVQITLGKGWRTGGEERKNGIQRNDERQQNYFKVPFVQEK